MTLGKRTCYYPHFKGKETEALRGELAWSGSHSQQVGAGFQTKSVQPQSVVSFSCMTVSREQRKVKIVLRFHGEQLGWVSEN